MQATAWNEPAPALLRVCVCACAGMRRYAKVMVEKQYAVVAGVRCRRCGRRSFAVRRVAKGARRRKKKAAR